MSLHGREQHDRVVITIDDDGHWQLPTHGPTRRGRGLAMIRNLIDHVDLDTGDQGTRLILTHHRPV